MYAYIVQEKNDNIIDTYTQCIIIIQISFICDKFTNIIAGTYLSCSLI